MGLVKMDDSLKWFCLKNDVAKCHVDKPVFKVHPYDAIDFFEKPNICDEVKLNMKKGDNMVKKLYGVNGIRFEVLEVCAETDETYAVISVNEVGKKSFCLVGKNQIVTDAGNFKEASSRFVWCGGYTYIGVVFFSEELAHDYVKAIKKYKDMWVLQDEIKRKEDSLKRLEENKEKLIAELKIDKETLVRLVESAN